jgi:hypothetical protein
LIWADSPVVRYRHAIAVGLETVQVFRPSRRPNPRASGSRGNNRHRQVNADRDRNVLGVEENIEQDIALSRARDTTVDLRNQLLEGQTPACDPPDLRRVL